jgi:hypothetical protein
MKIKAIVTINMGLYMDIRPEVEIDTEDYESSRSLLRELHANFFGLFNNKSEEDIVNDKIQQIANKARKGEQIPIGDWELIPKQDSLIPNNKIVNDAKKAFNREQYAKDKAEVLK